MTHSVTLDALILRTYDVGEADRFCVLFTLERGRISARAYGVRRPKSHMAASLLPFTHASIQLRENGDGFTIESAKSQGVHHADRSNLHWFMQATQGIELLLKLTEDGHPLPDVFRATLTFLTMCDHEERAAVSYAIRLLHLLGFLPATSHLERQYALSHSDREALEQARLGARHDQHMTKRLEQICSVLIEEHIASPLKAGKIAALL